ncbi:hypothetical protein SALIVB_1173 [Streptococcus salivarius CCHSS3]|nr:hypothetical protein SALIVB_1173 [Streptococcus salivarius CCHSS3]
MTVDDVDHDAGMVSINKTWDYKNDSGFMPTKIITTRLTGGLIKGYKPILPASA